MITNDGDNDLFTKYIHSALWRSGRTTGLLPKQYDRLYSDEFPKQFEIMATRLGKGGFGTVHLVIDTNRKDEEKFVAKKISQSQKDLSKWMNEASILIKLRHERIVQFHGFQKNETEIDLFLEFIKLGTLADFIKRNIRLNVELTRHFTIQILEGVKYLHENNILHLDIKGNNILMADESNIKLTDFGLSTIFTEEEGVQAERGTTRYMAPEMVDCPDGKIFEHAKSLDIWSVGCTVVEMATGSPPNSTTSSQAVLFQKAMLTKPKYELPVTASKYLIEFLDKTFMIKASDRPSAESLLKDDPFITGLMLTRIFGHMCVRSLATGVLNSKASCRSVGSSDLLTFAGLSAP
ncbi:mitogen-activated protein kinase kinase kinase 3-like [Physella acuta]|uniref:mitogen-activated protein kinase kinase kinase 3-like n=1 Tax=Physella acuta TaxID=109671 RepID=UPI0027DD55E3|nr:mitogen-activated protein kinase kinase kinase 3-like [Physella acuta]